MFISEYITEFYFNQLLDKYDENYLLEFDRNNFVMNLNILKKHNITCINEIVLYFLEIFAIDTNELDYKFTKLASKSTVPLNLQLNENIFILNNILD